MNPLLNVGEMEGHAMKPGFENNIQNGSDPRSVVNDQMHGNDSSEDDVAVDVNYKQSHQSSDGSYQQQGHILTNPLIPNQSAKDEQRGSDFGDQAMSDRSAHAVSSLTLPAKVMANLKKSHGAQIDDSDADDFTPAAPLTRRRSVLVAKCLTNSDASSGRIILPRVAVEANLPFVTAYRHYALTVRDSKGRRYEFVIKSWANGTEHRRVFVLEQAAEYLRSHGIGVGDAIGICTDENGELVVEANTAEVRQATICPKYGALALSAPPPGSNNALPLTASGRCIRSGHCTKPAGHPGFCSGPKAAAAASKPRRTTNTVRQQPLVHHLAAVAAAEYHHSGLDSQASEQAYMGDEYSSDETAATTVATPLHVNMPEGLHPIAHIPAGVRLIKTLTAYDISSQRVVMPAHEVTTGVTNARFVDVLTMAAVDEGQAWQFPTLRAWTSVTGRRGYMLEDASKFLTLRGAQAGDVLCVYRDTDLTPPRIELRAQGLDSSELRVPAKPDAACVTFAELPLLMHPKGRPRGSHTGTPRASVGGAMTCNRTNGCTKAAGHQGFCSGHKGFKKREGGTPTAAAAARHAFRLRAGSKGFDYDDYDEDYDWEGSEDDYFDDGTPSKKRARSTPRADDPLVSLLTLLDQ